MNTLGIKLDNEQVWFFVVMCHTHYAIMPSNCICYFYPSIVPHILIYMDHHISHIHRIVPPLF